MNLEYILINYGFLILRGERINTAMFADRIAQTYDLNNVRNAEAYRYLMTLFMRIEREHSGGFKVFDN